MASGATTPACSWAGIMAKLLLTGATGLVGSHIAELFTQKNIPIKCLVRKSSDVTFLKQLDVELTEGDVTDIQSLRQALEDVDYVIHTAGLSADWGKFTAFHQANVIGTMNILTACQEAGIYKLIITGSVSSYGEEDCSELKNEDSPYKSHYPYCGDGLFPSSMNHYRDTKAILTQRACAYATANNMDLTVIEPAWVYGEREFHTGFYEYVKAVKNGMRYAPGSRTNSFHVIYAPDLAEAYLLAWQIKVPGVQRVIIGNPSPEKLNTIHSLFCEAAGLRPPRLLPRQLLYPLGFGMELLATLRATKEPPLLTRSRVNMMYDSIGFSVEKARQLLGFTAKTPLREGVYRTVEWYRQMGLLKRGAT